MRCTFFPNPWLIRNSGNSRTSSILNIGTSVGRKKSKFIKRNVPPTLPPHRKSEIAHIINLQEFWKWSYKSILVPH